MTLVIMDGLHYGIFFERDCKLGQNTRFPLFIFSQDTPIMVHNAKTSMPSISILSHFTHVSFLNNYIEGRWGEVGRGEGLRSVQDKKVTRGGSNSLEQMTAANLGIYIPGDLYPYTSYVQGRIGGIAHAAPHP